MKLNYDYVREILLTLESELKMSATEKNNLVLINRQSVSLSELCKYLPNIPPEDIAYTSLKLSEAGYIEIKPTFASGGLIYHIDYLSISFEGHQYLDSVRNPKIWEKIKAGTVQLTFEIIRTAALSYAQSKFNF